LNHDWGFHSGVPKTQTKTEMIYVNLILA